MEAFYKLFDRFTEMIPPQLLPVIRLAAVLVWVVLAAIVVFLAWQQGGDSAPPMGQELSLAEIKARQQREANLKKPQNIRVPDLNELIPERPEEPLQYESRLRPTYERSPSNELPPIEAERAPRGPDEEVRRADGPLYSGEGLAPRDDRPQLLPVGPEEYRPARDQGVGGVREDRTRRLESADDNPVPQTQNESRTNSSTNENTNPTSRQPVRDPARGLDGQPLKPDDGGLPLLQ